MYESLFWLCPMTSYFRCRSSRRSPLLTTNDDSLPSPPPSSPCPCRFLDLPRISCVSACQVWAYGDLWRTLQRSHGWNAGTNQIQQMGRSPQSGHVYLGQWSCIWYSSRSISYDRRQSLYWQDGNRIRSFFFFWWMYYPSMLDIPSYIRFGLQYQLLQSPQSLLQFFWQLCCHSSRTNIHGRLRRLLATYGWQV